MGGHGRILHVDQCPWLEGQIESWEQRQERSDLEEQAERAAEEEIRRSVYAKCERCGATTEQCKGPSHRGQNRCMACCGGVADARRRICSNCIDIPYREKREQASGQTISYIGEQPKGY